MDFKLTKNRASYFRIEKLRWVFYLLPCEWYFKKASGNETVHRYVYDIRFYWLIFRFNWVIKKRK